MDTNIILILILSSLFQTGGPALATTGPSLRPYFALGALQICNFGSLRPKEPTID